MVEISKKDQGLMDKMNRIEMIEYKSNNLLRVTDQEIDYAIDFFEEMISRIRSLNNHSYDLFKNELFRCQNVYKGYKHAREGEKWLLAQNKRRKTNGWSV